MTTTLSDDEFVGYTFRFRRPPPRRSRLWFLDHDLRLLIPRNAGFPGTDLTVEVETTYGRWSATTPDGAEHDLTGLCIRYDNADDAPWTSIWQLTATVIPHVHTFGRDDDVWRLGIWPD